ncbi:hypothetical protein EDB19DRAFT_1840448 [Suillus lakei]|nr:hypothetical protein EDB19DRAFT_1840448 [Suillus lakei]
MSESKWSDDKSLCEFGGNDLEKNLAALRAEAESLHGHAMPTVPMFEKKTVVEWEKAEWNRALGYNGHLGRTKRRHDKAARELAEYHEKRKTLDDPQVMLMRKMFGRPRFCTPSPSRQPQNSNLRDFELASHGLCYLSDESDDGTESDGDDSDGDQPAVPPLKWHKLNEPYHEQRRLAKETRLDEMKKALTSIEKLLKAKKNGVCWRSKRVAGKMCTLDPVLPHNGHQDETALHQCITEGSVKSWICCKLGWPPSVQLDQAVYSLLGDPKIATELRTYVRSNKWVVNPEKLIQLSQDKLIPAEATKYTQNLVEEMPHGLKKYMELEIFPHNDLKHKPMMQLASIGFLRMNSICGKREQIMDFTKVMSSAPRLVIWSKWEKQWNMARTTKAIGALTEKIIPTFECAHGPGYQALFLIDNSQGHSTYAKDALLEMSFPPDHLEHPGKPKGVKAILTERGLYEHWHGKCKSKCKADATHCCNKHILELQPDFQEQHSLIQEIIKNASHLCIFLPKFHCELNFIKFFWGKTIRLWEHQTHRWLDAYRLGLGTKDAQLKLVTCLRLRELIAGTAVNVNRLLTATSTITQLSFHVLLPGLQMPRLSYVWCSCESYRCRDNPDESGQKLQAIQTAARHHNADQQLRDARAAEAVDDVASGHDLPAHEPFGANEPFVHGDDNGEVNFDPPELLDNLFEMGNEPPNIQGPDDFSTDDDEEIFRRLGRSNTSEDNAEDPAVPNDDPGAVPKDGDGVPCEDEAAAAIDLFVSQGTQFDFSDVQEAADIHADPPSCMDDHLAVCNAYIHAFISAAFYNATHAAVYHNLEGKEHLLRTAQQANPDIEYLGLNNFAHMLPTLLRRLGLSTDQFIVYFFALQRFLLQPGKWDQFQHWRGPEDQPGHVPPICGHGYDSFPDLSKPMRDIYDGYGWHMIEAGLERQRGGRWEIEDVDMHELHRRFVSLPCRLVWQINIDWFQAVKGKLGYHSTGAFYAVICNNPRSIRYLPEETILIMVMPGPNEPSLEEMNYLLEPFVESMLCLEKVVSIRQVHISLWRYAAQSPLAFAHIDFKDRDDWSSVIEFMHAMFLGLVKHLNRIILIKSGLLNGMRRVKPMDQLEAFFLGLFGQSKQIAYRLQSLSTGKGSPKADQWHNQIAVLFVALYDAWAVNSEIPDCDAPPSASNTKNFTAQATMQRTLRSRLLEHLLAHNAHPSDAKTDRVNSTKMDNNLRRHYAVILEFSAAVRILSSQSISPDDVHRGCAALSHATQSWARMGSNVRIWALLRDVGFAFERHNSKLAKINHNQHKGGELKVTLMQRWWSITFNYELILHIEALPNQTNDDKDSLQLLRMSLKTQQKDCLNAMGDNVTFTKHPKKLNLLAISNDIYQITYEYLRNKWSTIVHLKTSTNIMGDGENFMGNARSYSHLWLHGLRRVTDAAPLIADIAIVRHFISNDNIPEFPWALWATDFLIC